MSKAKLVIFIEDGVVDQVVSNESIEVVIVDRDSEGLDEDEVSIVMEKEAYVYSTKTAKVGTEMVQRVCKDVNR